MPKPRFEIVGKADPRAMARALIALGIALKCPPPGHPGFNEEAPLAAVESESGASDANAQGAAALTVNPKRASRKGRREQPCQES